MAIVFDSSASGKVASSADDVTVSHTLGSGSDRYVVAIQAFEDDVSTPGTPTYNGTAMDLAVDTGDNGGQRIRIYRLDEASLPAAGTYDAVSPLASGSMDQHTLFVYSYSGVAAGAPEASASNTNTASNSISVNITTLTDGARIVGGAIEHDFVAPDGTSGQTNIIKEAGGNAGSAAGDEDIPTAGIEAFSWDGSDAKDYNVAVVALAPAAGETPVSNTATLHAHHFAAPADVTKTTALQSYHLLGGALPQTLSAYHMAPAGGAVSKARTIHSDHLLTVASSTVLTAYHMAGVPSPITPSEDTSVSRSFSIPVFEQGEDLGGTVDFTVDS